MTTDEDVITSEYRAEDGQEKATGEPAAPFEIWAERRGWVPGHVDYWKLGAARAFKGWAAGQLVTEREFDDAVEAQGKAVSR